RDLQGESQPFDISDIIKCAQRIKELKDEYRVELGLRIIRAGMEFHRKGLKRDNITTSEIIQNFLAEKKVTPQKFQQYMEKLRNPRFQRLFDLTEIFQGEKEKAGEKEALELAKEILHLEYTDAYELFQKALKDFAKAWKKKIKGYLLVADVSDEPKFNVAARVMGAAIVIQRNKDGHTQLFFDTNKVDDRLTNALVSMIRLEECLLQKREIPNDLRRSGRIEEIPEWYYYKAPSVGKKQPGRFILNGSLTTTDVPVTHISLDTLREIAEKAIIYHPKFNWWRWKAERIAFYLKAKSA
ncbi:hypothetical protein J7L36_01195, partial [bacterium]|nr:hypothetical protein [bacterium]